MSTLKSSAEDLTLNADGSGNDIKFQSNAVEKASISSAGKVALGGSTAVTVDSQVAIHGGNLELTTAGSRYWIARASDAALTGSLYSPSDSIVRLSGAGTSAGIIEFEPRSSNGVIARVTGDGLCFGSDTAAANALDDYEEGTWTPIFSSSSGYSGQVYSLQQGGYTKIGNVVTANVYLTLSTKGSFSGTLYMAGFPFSAVSDEGQASAAIARVEQWNIGTNHTLCLHMNTNSGTFTTYTGGTAGHTTLTADGALNATSSIMLTMTYRI